MEVLKSSQADALIERFGTGQLVEQGLVTVIAVEAVKVRAASRWAMKQDTVWEFAERQFRKDFSPADHIVRLDDVHYLLIQPQESAVGAEGRSINLLRQVLEYFTGESLPGDVRVGRVTALTARELEHNFLSVQEIEEAITFQRRRTEQEQAPAAHPVVRKVGAPPGPEILFVSQPIWMAKKHAIVSYRLLPLVFTGEPRSQWSALGASTREVTNIDLMVLDHALSVLEGQAARRFGLHVPLHIQTLNSGVGRRALFKRLEDSGVKTGDRMIVCLQGLDAGVPRLVLESAVAALGSVTLGVIGQAPGLSTDISTWRDARLSALAFDFQDLTPAEEADLPAALGRFAGDLQGVGGSLFGYSARNTTQVVAAWAAGFTHLSGDAFAGPGALDYAAMRFEPARLFAPPTRPAPP